MGFRESADRRTGMERLWSLLRAHASPSCTVLSPWEWKDNMRSLAEFIVRNSNAKPRILVVAYSWGGGYAFPRFARCCDQLGVIIETACLCDPVFRSRLLPPWLPMNPLSLLRGPRIVVPGSVETVYWVRQKLFPPCGHDLVPADPEATEVLQPKILNVPHTRIDDSPAWRELVLKRAEAFVAR